MAKSDKTPSFDRKHPEGTPGYGLFPVRDQDVDQTGYYRERWRHDEVVRTTHGVNCSGSCSWRVFVRDGAIVGEAPATDYPDTPAGVPDQGPRGCARGLTSSWYDENPGRVRYPLVRGLLLDIWRQARKEHADPVEAWDSITRDPEQSALYIGARGHGGMVRTTWEEALELCAAAHVSIIKQYGPDRVAGFSPSPAASPVSQASGMRYLALTGGTQLSSYDLHADLPPAFPQAFGEQTDSPESVDWWDSSYLMLWGTNLPLTRTPDAHFMTEARYRGQKVVAVSPDYGEQVKFADEWLAVAPGMDSALAMAMGHVVLKEFYRDRRVPYFADYVKTYTDMPFLVILDDRGGDYAPGHFLTAADLGDDDQQAAWKTVVFDEQKHGPAVPNGSQGFRWAESGAGLWNLDLGSIEPALSLLEHADEQVELVLPRFDTVPPVPMHRSVPVLRVQDKLVTTVFDLLMAEYGLERGAQRGEWPQGYEDADEPFTPAWQERFTGIPAEAVIRVAREFAANAEQTEGKSLIVTGAGVSHWVNGDMSYRAMISLLALCGCVGKDGGGLAHYVGQHKIRTLAGWETLATASDWARPVRRAPATSWFYVASDQWRYETLAADESASPLARGSFRGKTPIDLLTQAARLGWQPFHPAFDRNPLQLADDAAEAQKGGGSFLNDYVADQLGRGALKSSLQDPDHPANWPRLLFVWRGNPLGGSMPGPDYALRHLVGSDVENVSAPEAPPERRPKDVTWRETAPVGKLDLLVDLDFRMTSTGAFADVLLPAATWYEKADLSFTDMHGFINCMAPAVDPQWEARSDWDAFRDLAAAFSRLAGPHLGVREDVVAGAFTKDTPGEASQPYGRVSDWWGKDQVSGGAAVDGAAGDGAAAGRTGSIRGVDSGETEGRRTLIAPGRNMPTLALVRRDFPAVHEQYASLGPLADTLGCTAKGLHWNVAAELDWLRTENGSVTVGLAGKGAVIERPSLHDARQAAEAMLALSPAGNRRLAREGFIALEGRVGMTLGDLAGDGSPARAGQDERIRWSDLQALPQRGFLSPEWSGAGSLADGSSADGDPHGYTPFAINVRHLLPWRTLTGRIQLAVDHEWFAEMGEFLPTFIPPLADSEQMRELATTTERALVLRYLTPHSKWSINSTFQDTPLLLTLSRGGPVVWLSPHDAGTLAIDDDDLVQIANQNGMFTCRAVISPRLPSGACYVYHAHDRQILVDNTSDGRRDAGTSSSPTRIVIKPTHLVGGYAQLSYALDYYGPTGAQRDEHVLVRRLTDVQEVDRR